MLLLTGGVPPGEAYGREHNASKGAIRAADGGDHGSVEAPSVRQRVCPASTDRQDQAARVRSEPY